MTEQQRIDAERLAAVQALTLDSGSHEEFSRGMCVMEAVSYVSGERWSDSPECASPVIAAFMRSWNDSLDDEARNRLLKPLIPKLVGTRALAEIEERRSYMALDWLVRVFTPKWLDMVPSLHEHAKALRELEAIADMAGAAAAGVRVRLASVDASAAGAAAGAAAWDAARAAAGAAARAAAWDAAGAAAWAAAAAAARDAAGAAARDAAGDAAWAKLRPTVVSLQDSAMDLVERMIAVSE